MAYDNFDFALGEGFLEVVGEALGGGADGVDVHAVAAGAHDAAQAACAELEVLVERLDEVCLVLGVKHFLYGLAGGFVVLFAEPLLCFGSDFFDKVCIIGHNSEWGRLGLC